MTHAELGIPTVEEALKANGMYTQLEAYVAANQSNAVEMAERLNKMFNTRAEILDNAVASERGIAYGYMASIYLVCIAITFSACTLSMFVNQFAR